MDDSFGDGFFSRSIKVCLGRFVGERSLVMFIRTLETSSRSDRFESDFGITFGNGNFRNSNSLFKIQEINNKTYQSENF